MAQSLALAWLTGVRALARRECACRPLIVEAEDSTRPGPRSRAAHGKWIDQRGQVSLHTSVFAHLQTPWRPLGEVAVKWLGAFPGIAPRLAVHTATAGHPVDSHYGSILSHLLYSMARQWLHPMFAMGRAGPTGHGPDRVRAWAGPQIWGIHGLWTGWAEIFQPFEATVSLHSLYKILIPC